LSRKKKRRKIDPLYRSLFFRCPPVIFVCTFLVYVSQGNLRTLFLGRPLIFHNIVIETRFLQRLIIEQDLSSSLRICPHSFQLKFQIPDLLSSIPQFPIQTSIFICQGSQLLGHVSKGMSFEYRTSSHHYQHCILVQEQP
jgi:hypothetical protein